MPTQSPEPSDEEIQKYARNLEAQARAVERAKELLETPECVICSGHSSVIRRDEFGYPMAIGFDHEPNCPLA